MSGLEPDVARGGTDGTVKEKWVQPPPLVINREWDESDPAPPNSALTLIKKAHAAGWTVRMTYAQGVHAPKRGTTTPVVTHSCAVRLSRGAQRAYAAWETPAEAIAWKSTSAGVLGGWLAPIVTELGASLSHARLVRYSFSLTSTEISDLIQLPELGRTILFDSQYDHAQHSEQFISLSLFKEFIGEPAVKRAAANAEKKAKKAKANPTAAQSLAETMTAEDFNLTGDGP